MKSDLTLSEAVPLLTVGVQRVLEGSGVRSLAIKGPAFEQLGVRRAGHSNDVDVMIHRGDRARATAVLTRAGWSNVSHWFPPALDDVIYSTTFRHPLYPVTVDLHHTFSGFLERPDAFDVMWANRTTVRIAHQDVATLSREHAMVLEALNALKVARFTQWDTVSRGLVADAAPMDSAAVAAAAESIGARHAAGSLVAALGGPPPSQTPPASYWRWRADAGRRNNRMVVAHLLRRAPLSIPKITWQQLTLTDEVARYWASTQGIEFTSTRDVLARRVRLLVRK